MKYFVGLVLIAAVGALGLPHYEEWAQQRWSEIDKAIRVNDLPFDKGIAMIRPFVLVHPWGELGEGAATRQKEWEFDQKLEHDAEVFENRPDVSLSERVTKWMDTVAAKKTGHRIAYARQRAEYWLERVKAYQGPVELTVLGASGLRPVHTYFGSRGTYFTITRDGSMIYKSRTITDSPAPEWNEKVTVPVTPSTKLSLELRNVGLLIDEALLHADLNPPPLDGRARLANDSTQVFVQVQRKN